MIARTSGRMAHDLKNLLTAIAVNAEVALQDLEADGNLHREELDEILAAAHRANTLLDQLLAFGRRQMLRVEVVDVNQVVDEAIASLRQEAREGHDIDFLPTAEAAFVRTDRQQLIRLVGSLVTNAWEAMDAGGSVRVCVRFVCLSEARRYGDVEVPPAAYVLLAVEDPGSGMAPEVLDRVFQPFFTTKEQHSKLGLGLSVAYGLVKQSGGYIFASSREGAGSLFEVYLPAANDEEAAPVALDRRDAVESGRGARLD